jgi:phosphonoacetate hydrolase
VRVHLTHESDIDETVLEMVEYCRHLPQVEAAYTGVESAALFEMPADREGDLVVIARSDAVIGGREDEHDLAQFQGHQLRSHGGLSEQAVPLLRSMPLEVRQQDAGRVWRNFYVFDIALNY